MKFRVIMTLTLLNVVIYEAPALGKTADLNLTFAGSPRAVIQNGRACDAIDIPDTPARLYRDQSGNIVMFASHFMTRRLLSGDSKSFKRDGCNVVLKSQLSADPSVYSDRSWISSTWTLDGKKVIALVHNEYQAERHAGACVFSSYLACWYNSIVMYQSDDSGRSFHHVTGGGFVAGANERQNSGQGEPRGAFNSTNIIHWHGFYYVLVWFRDVGQQPGRECVLRSNDVRSSSSWKGWDGSNYSVNFSDPYARDQTAKKQSCSGLKGLVSVVGSISMVKSSGIFVAVFIKPDTATLKGGVAFSTSRDLVNWSQPKEIGKLPTLYSSVCRQTKYSYPSLQDLKSESKNFESVGMNPELLMTASDFNDCSKKPIRRYLVEYPIKIR